MGDRIPDGLDVSWIDSLVDSLGITDEAARVAVKDKILAGTLNPIKNYQQGMTKAQGEADTLRKERAQLQQRAAVADQWDKWVSDYNLRPILSDWNTVAPHFSRFRTAEELAAALAPQKPGQVQQQAAEQTQEVLEEYQAGELSEEQAMKRLRAIDRELRSTSGQVQDLVSWRDREVPQLIKQVQDAVGALQKAQMETSSGLANELLMAIDYAQSHPKRRVTEVVKAMGENGYKTFNEAAVALYGEEDRSSDIEAEVEKRYQAKMESHRREQEKQKSEGEPPAVPSWRMPRNREEKARVPLNPDGWRNAVLQSGLLDGSGGNQ